MDGLFFFNGEFPSPRDRRPFGFPGARWLSMADSLFHAVLGCMAMAVGWPVAVKCLAKLYHYGNCDLEYVLYSLEKRGLAFGNRVIKGKHFIGGHLAEALWHAEREETMIPGRPGNVPGSVDLDRFFSKPIAGILQEDIPDHSRTLWHFL